MSNAPRSDGGFTHGQSFVGQTTGVTVPERAGTEKVPSGPPTSRTHADEQIESIAQIIAFWHGAKVLYIKDGMNTVASCAGYGHWGDAPEKYSNACWREYEQAAKAMLTIMDANKEDAPHHCEHSGVRLDG